MDNLFMVRSGIALVAILAGCGLIGMGTDREVACVAGGIALLFYAFGVMLSLRSRQDD